MAKGPITSIKSCKQCGADYEWRSGEMGERRGTCSDDCRKAREAERQAAWQARNKKPKEPKPKKRMTCGHCGNEFECTRKRKYCSPRCRQPDKRVYQRIEQPIIPCVYCGKLFQRFNSANTLCSNACKIQSWKVRHGKRSKHQYRPYAVVREIDALKRIARRAPISAHKIKILQRKRKIIERRAQHACEDCGTSMRGISLRIKYCNVCKVEREKRSKRSARAAGKARKRNATVERFDPVSILERDGWRCHICGIKTPKRLRGTYEDNAPELDHIIPLAAGGEHSRRNTACSCRKCNIAKSDKPLGQLRLVA